MINKVPSLKQSNPETGHVHTHESITPAHMRNSKLYEFLTCSFKSLKRLHRLFRKELQYP